MLIIKSQILNILDCVFFKKLSQMINSPIKDVYVCLCSIDFILICDLRLVVINACVPFEEFCEPHLCSPRARTLNGGMGGERMLGTPLASSTLQPCPQTLLSLLWCSVLCGQVLLSIATWAGHVLGPKQEILKCYFSFFPHTVCLMIQ